MHLAEVLASTEADAREHASVELSATNVEEQP